MKKTIIIILILIVVLALSFYLFNHFQKVGEEKKSPISMEKQLLLKNKPLTSTNTPYLAANQTSSQAFNQEQIKAINRFVGVNTQQEIVNTNNGTEIKHNGKYKHALVIKVTDKKIEKIEIGPNGLEEKK